MGIWTRWTKGAAPLLALTLLAGAASAQQAGTAAQEPRRGGTLIAIIQPANGSGYRSAEVDALIAASQGEADPQKRIQIFKQLQKVVLTDLPTLPLVELKFFTVEAANLRHPQPRGDQVYGSFRDFWFDDAKAEPKSN